jgi:hypothetical protein
MTEHDGDYERWLRALNSLQEVSGQYQALSKTVQVALGFLSDESAATARRLTRIEAKMDAMDVTFHKLLPHVATIAAYIVAQEQRDQQRPSPQPQPRPRQSRRANGE